MLLEVINENQTRWFGWAVKNVMKKLEGSDNEKADIEGYKLKRSVKIVFNIREKNFLQSPGKDVSVRHGRMLKWFLSKKQLLTYYIHELGCIGSLVHFIGVSIFWISGFTGIPGITIISALILLTECIGPANSVWFLFHNQ